MNSVVENRKLRILVIEDESSIADNIIYALSTEGFEVSWCKTGSEGVARIAATNSRLANTESRGTEVNLVILDVGLPDESGFEVAKKLRNLSAVPIIFVTARSSEIDRIVGLEIGADDYVVKPFSPRELTARVRAVLRRTASADAQLAIKEAIPSNAESTPTNSVAEELSGLRGVKRPEFCYGPFKVSQEKHRIEYFGQVPELSRYEFRLLVVLLKSPGRVFSREHLMQLVWEVPEMSLERTVDTHIKTIRQKLREIKDEEMIITVRGVGYSMREGLGK